MTRLVPCRLARVLAFCACAVLAGCASMLDSSADEPLISPEAMPPVRSAYEQKQVERAREAWRRRRLADAGMAWEILTVLRPEVPEYRTNLEITQRQIEAAVSERMPRAEKAAQRGDIDGAMQQYLAILALQPDSERAADALRALERERIRRDYLGKPSRLTLARRAQGEANRRRPASRADGG